jgi:hypothetical protein
VHNGPKILMYHSVKYKWLYAEGTLFLLVLPISSVDKAVKAIVSAKLNIIFVNNCIKISKGSLHKFLNCTDLFSIDFSQAFDAFCTAPISPLAK